ncbi:MAG: hypothetical protein ACOC85_03500 [Thermoplasmatota archaeon]
MRKYITLVGRSYWSTLNSLWAVLKNREFIPDEVFLITDKSFKENAEILKKDIKILLTNYDIDAQVFIEMNEDVDLYHTGQRIQDIIEKEDENEVALDITGGRKTAVAGALVNPGSKYLKHVFYLYLDKIEGASRPYPSIELDRMKIRDFVDIYKEDI